MGSLGFMANKAMVIGDLREGLLSVGCGNLSGKVCDGLSSAVARLHWVGNGREWVETGGEKGCNREWRNP